MQNLSINRGPRNRDHASQVAGANHMSELNSQNSDAEALARFPAQMSSVFFDG